ncbi:MAG: hypothetical protein IJD40_08025 [Lachnospiraceae bacterium]|nr:hypothetical protein [Lachnospiraceae bacterium]
MQFTYEDVSKIVKASKDTTENNRNYQLLYKRFLKRMWEEQPNHQVMFCLAISPEDVDALKFEDLEDKLKIVVSSLGEANYLKIDNEGNIVETKYIEGDTSEVKKRLSELSARDYLFFFGEQDITKFINGAAVDENNIFYSRSDRMKYREKKDISKINEVMDNYTRQHVTKQVNYMVFFADSPTLYRIDPNLKQRNILRNKPEHYMRDQLCDYLTDNMKYTFTTEPELGQSKRELDIYFDVSGELYFIEVKWLGVSLNDSGNGLSTSYTDARARDGVTQTLEYIEELMNTSEKSLRHGYLAIFDARDNKSNIDFQEYRFVRKELETYLPYFSVLKVIPLEKRHPA